MPFSVTNNELNMNQLPHIIFTNWINTGLFIRGHFYIKKTDLYIKLLTFKHESKKQCHIYSLSFAFAFLYKVLAQRLDTGNGLLLFKSSL